MFITGARGTDHPPFSNFLFTNVFSKHWKLHVLFIINFEKLRAHEYLSRDLINNDFEFNLKNTKTMV
jgi:hypothetical protein